LAKSDFGQTTITYERLAGGEWQATRFVKNKFKIDANDYPDGMGGTISWKAVDANTWETVAKANGKITATDTLKLSADGNTLTDAAKQMKPDGGSMEGPPSTSGFPAVRGLPENGKQRRCPARPGS
jgi:hypothetical protein